MPRRTLPRALAVTAVAAATLLAACTDSDPAADAPTPSSTSLPATSSSAPPTTPPETTTTIAATTTTTLSDVEAQIRLAINAYWTGYIECGQLPAECNPADYLAPDSEALGVGRTFVDDLVGRGLYFSEDLNGTTWVVDTIQITATGATTVSCVRDGLIVLGPDGPDGQPTVISDSVAFVNFEHDLVFVDGVWLVAREVGLGELAAGETCV